MRALIFLLSMILGASAAMAGTPLTEPLPEETEITITCELTRVESPRHVPVLPSPAECQQALGTYHYKLWLPRGYAADPQRRWPCVFIAAPDGDAKMGAMEPRLKRGGYVVAMLVESRNGPWAPIVGNFLAAHDDLVQRVRIQEGRKFATGLSGGGRASSLFVQLRPGFAGVILQGAGFFYDAGNNYETAGLDRAPSLLVAMTMGDADRNKKEVAWLKSALPSFTRFAPFRFSGGHVWAPARTFNQALTWMERQLAVAGRVRSVARD